MGDIITKGEFGPAFIERVTRDRLGFVSAALRKDYDPTKFPTNIPSPPQNSVFGAIHTRTEMSLNAGVMTVRWIYDGIESGSSSTNPIYEMDTSFENVDIRNHPDFEQIAATYGGITDAFGNVRFPTTYNGSKNPLAGVQSFYRIGGVWREMYATRKLNTSFAQRIGFIIAKPPGNPPPIGRDRDWLEGPVRAIWRGNAYEVTKEYWLSGRGGWVKPVYNRSI